MGMPVPTLPPMSREARDRLRREWEATYSGTGCRVVILNDRNAPVQPSGDCLFCGSSGEPENGRCRGCGAQRA